MGGWRGSKEMDRKEAREDTKDFFVRERKKLFNRSTNLSAWEESCDGYSWQNELNRTGLLSSGRNYSPDVGTTTAGP